MLVRAVDGAVEVLLCSPTVPQELAASLLDSFKRCRWCRFAFFRDLFSASRQKAQKSVERSSALMTPFALLGFSCDFSLSVHLPRLVLRDVVP